MSADGAVQQLKPALLRRIHPLVHNCLLLMWRARAELLGGVPTLRADHSGVDLQPYQRLKRIGSRATGSTRQARLETTCSRASPQRRSASNIVPIRRCSAGRR